MKTICKTFACGILGAIVACSGGSNHPGVEVTAGGGAGAPAAGSAGFFLGGNAGDGATGGSAGAQAAGSSGTAGRVGGTAGASGAGTTALDPTLPTPSHDCRTDTSSDNCISIAGTYQGAAIDVYCNVDDLAVAVHGGEWVIGCDHLGYGFARLYVPIQMPGTFAETVTPGSAPKMEFELSVGDGTTSVFLLASNLIGAKLAGSVDIVSGKYRTVSGTFHGAWGKPDATCSAFTGTTCAVTDINVSFRIYTYYGSCFSDNDCAAGLTCDPIARSCFTT